MGSGDVYKRQLQQDLARGAVGEVLAADDVGDALLGVVDDDGELVGEDTVGALEHEVADGVFAYQLAVVVDDADQGVTDVVRGEDLADSTARQIVLQRVLGVATPRYLHTPLVRTADGAKLSKQTGATPLVLADPLAALRDAGQVLGLPARGTTIADWLASAIGCWRERIVAS